MKPKFFLATIIILSWIHFGNMISVIYLCHFDHVPGVATFSNWTPTILSTMCSLTLISLFYWSAWKGKPTLFGPIVIFSVTLQIISSIVLSILNSDATSENSVQLTRENSLEIKLGTEEDVDIMVEILAMFSTAYNWSVTSCIVMLSFVHLMS